MKKLLLLLTSIVGLCFVSCGAADSSSGSSASTSSVSSSAEGTQTKNTDPAESKKSSDSSEQTGAQDNTSTDTLSLNNEKAETKLHISVGDNELTATLSDNSSAKALVELLKKGDITIDMSDYSNFEKVGELPESLPTNDEKTDTDYGDLILYLGHRFVIYYDKNSWNFTKLGHIDSITQEELKSILGEGDVTVTLSLK